MAFTASQAPTTIRSRFNLDDARSTPLARDGERVTIGVDPKDGSEHLVYVFGEKTLSVPIYAAAAAIVAGRVVTHADLAAALVESGQGGKVKAAIEKCEQALARKSGAGS